MENGRKMGDRWERFCYAGKGSPRGELSPVRATERGLQFLRLIVITPLRLDKLGTRPRAPSLALRAIHLVSPRRGFFTACGFVTLPTLLIIVMVCGVVKGLITACGIC